MFNLDTLKKYDSQGIHKVYDRWPEISRESYESNLDGIDFKDINHIVFAGMGGSGALGDIFYSVLSKTNLHVSIVKGYLLPKTVDSNTLLVATSVSGNTVETLTVLDSANKMNCKVVCFSSGGMMQEYCAKNKIEHRNVPQIHSPRASFTSFLYSMLKTLESVIPVKKEDITESLTHLEDTRKRISWNNLSENNPSLNLAEWISGVPLIYYPWGLEAAAIRFKNSLQENAKTHAIAEDVVEASHNGIVCWEKPSSVKPILIEGEDDYIKTKERWKILMGYFEKNMIDYREVSSVRGSILSKLINLVYELDYSTIYYAVISGRDPSPIESIDYVKKMMS